VRVDRRFLNWGVFLVVLGLVPLLVRLDMISSGAIREAWRLWPLVFVGLGLGLLLRQTPVAPMGGLVVAGTLGLVIGSLIGVGGSISAGCGIGQGAGPVVQTSRSGLFRGPSAEVTIAIDCGQLEVGAQGGAGWSVEAQDPAGHPVLIDAGLSDLTVRTPGPEDFFGLFTGGRGPRSWAITLPEDPQLDVQVDMNAGDGRLDLGYGHVGRLSGTFNAADVRIDLSDATVGGLELTLNAGSGKMSFPSRSSFQGSLKVNAASVAICVPQEVGLRVEVRGALHSADFGPQGLVKTGDTWETPNWGVAAERIDLQIDANAASVSLNPPGGCR
jgi:hypothetical protein